MQGFAAKEMQKAITIYIPFCLCMKQAVFMFWLFVMLATTVNKAFMKI